jgi:hypothetical protein
MAPRPASPGSRKPRDCARSSVVDPNPPTVRSHSVASSTGPDTRVAVTDTRGVVPVRERVRPRPRRCFGVAPTSRVTPVPRTTRNTPRERILCLCGSPCFVGVDTLGGSTVAGNGRISIIWTTRLPTTDLNGAATGRVQTAYRPFRKTDWSDDTPLPPRADIGSTRYGTVYRTDRFQCSLVAVAGPGCSGNNYKYLA